VNEEVRVQLRMDPSGGVTILANAMVSEADPDIRAMQIIVYPLPDDIALMTTLANIARDAILAELTMTATEVASMPVTGQNTDLGMSLTLSAFKRGAQSQNWWRNSAYCLDAPCVLPGGSMIWDQVDDDLGFATQTFVER
jgi:hypothetical protein